MKQFTLRGLAFVSISIRRLIAQPGLALLSLLGLVLSITLVLSIPLYSDTVYHRTFLENLDGNLLGEAQRPPFSFLYAYIGGWQGSRQWEQVQPADQFLTSEMPATLGMPVRVQSRYFATDAMGLFPENTAESDYGDPTLRLSMISVATMSDIENHIELVEGSLPQPAPPSAEPSRFEVLVSLPFANDLGLQSGEDYTLLANDVTETGAKVQVEYPIRIAGIWQPIDPADEYWMFNPSHLIDTFLVPQDTFVNQLSPFLPGEVYSAFWYLVNDGSNVRFNQVASLLGRITRLQNQANSLLPGVDVTVSPVQNLVNYRRAAALLTILLYAFAIPIIALTLAFIGLVANLSIERKQNEIAVTRSRGAPTSQVLASVSLESILLGVLALVISLPLATMVSQIMSQSRGFGTFIIAENGSLRSAFAQLLAFLSPAAPDGSLSSTGLLNAGALWAGVVAVVVSVLAAVTPAFRASRHTIVSYKQERARNSRRPWWQRAYLDFLLLIPVAYGIYQLEQQGRIVDLSLNPSGAASLGNPLGNPLLLLVPSLAVLTFSLLCLRLIPYLMAALAWLAAHTRSVGILLAARHLARSPGTYSIPFLILVFTLSLSAYTASLAKTLDRNLAARSYYQVGADMKFTEVGETQATSPFEIAQSTPEDEYDGPAFVFLPVSEYRSLPGVEAVTRIGSYPGFYESSAGSSIKGRYYGIDRIEFPQIASWRRDFASESLGELMNRLAAKPDGVLVTDQLMADYNLRLGDTIQLRVDTYLQSTEMELDIVGSFRLFPSWYPEEGPLFVGNLDHLFAQAGSEFPYHVWLKINSQADPAAIQKAGISGINLRIVNWDAVLPHIIATQQQPERQGVFGLLFIGFAASAIMTVLGFLLYALFSYRRRFIELGVLRAGGLSRLQMSVYLAFEMLFLVGLGGLLGTALGIWSSSYFIPFLQVGLQASELIPPFEVVIDYPTILQIYSLILGLFLVTFVILVIMLLRMKIFQAIKLGETV